MSPAELAAQQLAAAWWSVAAAWVQAVGSVGAIIAAMVIAHRADMRAAAAEKRADDRARDAEAASIARAEAAERRAEQQIRDAELVRKGRLASVVLRLVDEALDDLRGSIERCEAQASEGGHVYGSWDPPVAADARRLISDKLREIDDVDMYRTMRDLGLAIEPTGPGKSVPWPEHIEFLKRALVRIEARADALRQYELRASGG